MTDLSPLDPQGPPAPQVPDPEPEILQAMESAAIACAGAVGQPEDCFRLSQAVDNLANALMTLHTPPPSPTPPPGQSGPPAESRTDG